MPHGSQVPVLLVAQMTEVPHTNLQRILVPLDGSKLAEQALPTAVALANKADAEVMLIRAVQTLNDTNRRILFANEEEAADAFDKYRLRADKYLIEIERQLHLVGVMTQHQTLLTDPSTGICDTAIEADVNLIVMSSHGRTGIGRWYYGSVANKVFRSVHCPVLLVHSSAQDFTPSMETAEEDEPSDGPQASF